MPEPIQTPAEGTEPVEETTITTPPTDETPDPQEPQSEPQTSPDPNPGPAEPDYRVKFAESTRENQILSDKLVQFESRKETTNDPTEADLRAAFLSWDTYTDSEKELARGQMATRRMSETALRAQQTREAQEKFDRELEIAITANPSLDGKERAFKEFANKPTHRGASTEVLVDAFLHRSSTVTTPKRAPAPGLQTGTGGPRESAKPKALSATELKHLRETDADAHRLYVTTHNIDLDL